jgi:hypothetical protein
MLVRPPFRISEADASVEFKWSDVNSAATNPYTFSNSTILANRVVVITSNGGGAGNAVSSITVDGNSCTLDLSVPGNANHDVEFWSVDLASPTSGSIDVVVTFTGSAPENCGVKVHQVDNGTAAGTISDSYSEAATTAAPSGPVTAPSGSVVIAASTMQGSAGVVTTTYTNATEDVDETVDAAQNLSHASASDAYAAGQDVTITSTASAATDRHTLGVIVIAKA